MAGEREGEKRVLGEEQIGSDRTDRFSDPVEGTTLCGDVCLDGGSRLSVSFRAANPPREGIPGLLTTSHSAGRPPSEGLTAASGPRSCCS